MIFVDTPGFFDKDALKREKNLEQILEYIQKNYNSIGAIWLCQKKGNMCIYENELKRIFNLNMPDSDKNLTWIIEAFIYKNNTCE